MHHGPWDVRLEVRDTPARLGPTGVLVRVYATGICGTDLGIVQGLYHANRGVVIGHESAGVVAAVGEDVDSVRPGDRVVIDPTFYCGYCRMCRMDRPNHCLQKASRESGVSADGTFATHYVSDVRFVYPIADHVPLAEASMAEPLSCVLTGLNQIRLRADFDTLVVGAGPMGMLYCLALASRGLTGHLVEVSASRRALAAARVPDGWHVVGPTEVQGLFDLIVETSGCATEWALQRLHRGGQVLAVGLTQTRSEVRAGVLADRSQSIVGSIDSVGTFSLAVRMIATGTIAVARLITHQLPLTDYPAAFGMLGIDLARQRRDSEALAAIKVVLVP